MNSNNAINWSLVKVLALATASSIVFSTTALAQEVPASDAPSMQLRSEQDLLHAMDQLSRDTESVSEDVNRLNSDVADKERQREDVEKKLQAVRLDVQRKQQSVSAMQDDVSSLIVRRMRGDSVDPLTTALGASDAQDAIDRNSYLKQLFRKEEATIEKAVAARDNANKVQRDLQGVKADLEKQLDELSKMRQDLDARKTDLDKQTERIRAAVDAMDPAARAAWIGKNNPVTEGLEGLFGASGVVDAAMSKIGSPYEWGAIGPQAFDCSGLMYWAYQQMGKSIPRTSQAQLAGGTPVSRENLQPGDIIGFYPGVTHVGMYVGNGQIIHASDYGIPVQVVSIDQGGPYQGAVRY